MPKHKPNEHHLNILHLHKSNMFKNKITYKLFIYKSYTYMCNPLTVGKQISDVEKNWVLHSNI